MDSKKLNEWGWRVAGIGILIGLVTLLIVPMDPITKAFAVSGGLIFVGVAAGTYPG